MTEHGLLFTSYLIIYIDLLKIYRCGHRYLTKKTICQVPHVVCSRYYCKRNGACKLSYPHNCLMYVLLLPKAIGPVHLFVCCFFFHKNKISIALRGCQWIDRYILYIMWDNIENDHQIHRYQYLILYFHDY